MGTAGPAGARALANVAWAACALLGPAACAVLSVRYTPACGAWWPPATLVCGAGLAAVAPGRWAAAALLAWAGLLHGAAAGLPGGACVAAAAVVLPLMTVAGRDPVRGWALAGPTGFGWSAACGLAGGLISGTGEIRIGAALPDPVGLVGAILFGLAGAGLAACVGTRRGGAW